LTLSGFLSGRNNLISHMLKLCIRDLAVTMQLPKIAQRKTHPWRVEFIRTPQPPAQPNHQICARGTRDEQKDAGQDHAKWIRIRKDVFQAKHAHHVGKLYESAQSRSNSEEDCRIATVELGEQKMSSRRSWKANEDFACASIGCQRSVFHLGAAKIEDVKIPIRTEFDIDGALESAMSVR